MGSGGTWPLGTHCGRQGIRECDLHSGPWKGLFTGAYGPFSFAFVTSPCRWREGRYLGGFRLGVSSCPVLGKTCGKGVAETNRLCVSRGGLMFMGSGPLAQRVSFPPARLKASLWLGPYQVAQQRLSQVGLGVAAPSSQSWAPAQAPKDGSPPPAGQIAGAPSASPPASFQTSTQTLPHPVAAASFLGAEPGPLSVGSWDILVGYLVV